MTPERAGGRPAALPDGPVPSSQAGERLLDLVRVMARLRGPDGCPWDRKQDHRSLARHLLEEAHEALEAIDAGDLDALRDELGDLLLQVVFHAQMAAEEGRFDVDDVAGGLVAKLVSRHPHVFGDARVSGADEVLVNWERQKAAERDPHGVDERIPETLPALARAAKVQRRAAADGFDFTGAPEAFEKLREEVHELADEVRRTAGEETEGPPDERVDQELGDVLFAAAAVARKAGVDPEGALRRATARFAGRFDAMTARAADEGVDLGGLAPSQLTERFRAER